MTPANVLMETIRTGKSLSEDTWMALKDFERQAFLDERQAAYAALLNDRRMLERAAGLPQLEETRNRTAANRPALTDGEVRRTYFGIRSVNLRQRVMRADRAVQDFEQNLLSSLVFEAKFALADAKTHLRKPPYSGLFFIGVFAGVYAGSSQKLMPSIVGAVFAVVGGWFLVARSERSANETFKTATVALQTCESNFRGRVRLMPTFADEELLTGHPSVFRDRPSSAPFLVNAN